MAVEHSASAGLLQHSSRADAAQAAFGLPVIVQVVLEDVVAVRACQAPVAHLVLHATVQQFRDHTHAGALHYIRAKCPNNSAIF